MNPLSQRLQTIATGKPAQLAAVPTPPAAPARKPWEIVNSKVPPEGLTRDIPREWIVPDPDQPRKEFEPGKMEELVDSLRQHGQLVDLIVYAPFSYGEPFLISAGERRWRASELVPLTTLRCRVKPRPADQIHQLILALVDGLQRVDLGPIEAARSYRRLEREGGLSQAEIARRLSIPRPRVNEMSKIMDLDDATLAKAQVEGWSAQRLIQMARATPEERRQMDEVAASLGVLTGSAAAGIRASRRSPKKGKAAGQTGGVGEGASPTENTVTSPTASWSFEAPGGAVVSVNGAKDKPALTAALKSALASLASNPKR